MGQDVPLDKVSDVITIRTGANGVVVGEDGALWITHESENLVSRVDPVTRQLTHEIGTDGPARSMGLLAFDGAVWVLSDSAYSRITIP